MPERVARFTGKSKHTLDLKGRISLPAKFRKELPDNVTLYVDTEGALCVYTEERFYDWVDSVFEKPGTDGDRGYNPRSKSERARRRTILSAAEIVAVDAAGRINIPENLIEAAGLQKNVSGGVLIIGNDDHIELWDVETWDAYDVAADGELGSLFDED